MWTSQPLLHPVRTHLHMHSPRCSSTISTASPLRTGKYSNARQLDPCAKHSPCSLVHTNSNTLARSGHRVCRTTRAQPTQCEVRQAQSDAHGRECGCPAYPKHHSGAASFS
ncbi:hypothetical protein DUNSADRAFT_402 [Dunaliella salina]|uniref:Encoded protein n=1 Tax=Dunaliella salina TaxID=3046 RepID=A0ABQ7FZ20_DUNSA|nr:hypothetical protein DUNSADRAFT_402 [Dunaliella salina]|eukprot:KAF5827588.1 hypothetical protein DUNSADRAFT_402 [Dunaliella salina]